MSKLDPRTKIVMLFAISGVAMLTSNLWFLVGLLVFTVLLLLVGKVGLSKQKKQFMGIISMLVFLFLIQAIFGQAYFGAVLCVRLIIVVMSALILLTGQMRDYLLALVQMKVPYELAYMVVLAFHFFPILRQEALDVYHSIQLRGCELKKTSLKNKLIAFKGMCIPILAGALARAQDTAIAMEARGFRMYRKRTYMRKLKLAKKDIALLILFPVLAVGFIAGAYTYENNKVVIPEKQVTVSLINNYKIAVSWTDDEAYEGVVRMGFGSYDAECIRVDQTNYRYTAMIDDLKPGKKYKYTFGHGKDMSEEITYRHEVDAKEYSFLYFGGVQNEEGTTDYNQWSDMVIEAYEVQSSGKVDGNGDKKYNAKGEIVRAADADIAFGLFGGNLISDNGNVSEWTMVYDRLESFFVNKPMMTAVGDNETVCGMNSYRDMVVMPTNGKGTEEYYYFDYGDAFVITLNSSMFTEDYKQSVSSEEEYQELVTEATEWLDRMLRTNDRPWIIINMHHSMFPMWEEACPDADPETGAGEIGKNEVGASEPGESVSQLMQQYWEPIFAEYGVDLVLTGDQGMYFRTSPLNNITYISVHSGEVLKENQISEETSISEISHFGNYYDEGATYIRVDVTENWLDIYAYNENHEQVDQYQIHK